MALKKDVRRVPAKPTLTLNLRQYNSLYGLIVALTYNLDRDDPTLSIPVRICEIRPPG